MVLSISENFQKKEEEKLLIEDYSKNERKILKGKTIYSAPYPKNASFQCQKILPVSGCV